MKKYFSILIFMVIISISFNVHAETTEYQKLKDYINNYVEFIEKSKSELRIDEKEALKYYDIEESLDYLYLNAVIERRKLQVSDLKYKIINNDINIKSITEKDGIYNIELEKNSKIIYNCMNGDLSEEVEYHNILVKKVSDNNYDDYREELGITKNAQFKSVKNNVEKYLNEEKKVVKQEKQKLDNIRIQLKNNSLVAIEENDDDMETVQSYSTLNSKAKKFTNHSYNRTKAREYALKYVKSPNPEYPNFERPNGNGNCTNFTSQCLYTGGIIKDKVGNYQWYYDGPGKRAPAWTGANAFRKYYKNNVGSETVKGLKAKTCTLAKTRLGDLVQFVNSSGNATHTMFISDYMADNWANDNPWEYKYDVKICQNSVDKSGRLKNVPLKSKNTTLKIEYIHIYGSYY